MSLDFNLAKIENHATLCYQGEGDNTRMNPVTEVIIFGSMFVGLPVITADNAETFQTRLQRFWGEDGPLVWVDDDGLHKRHVTLDEVRAHVGLKTNATQFTNKQFERNMRLKLKREAADREYAAKRAASQV